MAVTITPEQAQALEILKACGENERIALAQALLPPGFAVMRDLPQERIELFAKGLLDGTIDPRDQAAVERALKSDDAV